MDRPKSCGPDGEAAPPDVFHRVGVATPVLPHATAADRGIVETPLLAPHLEARPIDGRKKKKNHCIMGNMKRPTVYSVVNAVALTFFQRVGIY